MTLTKLADPSETTIEVDLLAQDSKRFLLQQGDQQIVMTAFQLSQFVAYALKERLIDNV